MLLSLMVAVGLNVGLFLPAYKFQTDKLTDITYALTFGILALLQILGTPGVELSGILLVAMVWVWAVRLGGYLLVRINKMGRDKRFDERRSSFWQFLNFWLLQGVGAWIIMLPVILFFEAGTGGRFGVLAPVGILVWALGLGVETTADYQKFRFNAESTNRGKWISSGLWQYSRHPNYLGEILVWLGVFIYTAMVLRGADILLAAVSPIFVFTILRFVSGVPLLEKSGEEKWGRDKDYQDYKKSTGLILPKLQKP